MHRRTRRTLLIVAAVLAALAVAVFLRSKAPPEAARLLPESDGIVYVNLQPLRVFLRKDLNPPHYDPDYQAFIDATGINWERDLDQVAVALHRMPNPNGPNGPVAYSMVFVGRITGRKLNEWLAAHAASRESYAGKTIYNVPSDGRTVRVSQIGYDMVAVSNTPTPEQIHSIIDRHRTAALPFAGSTLLQRHYQDVPLLSIAWGVGQIGLPFSQSGSISVLGLQLPVPDNTTLVASVAPTLPLASGFHVEGLLRCRVEEFAPSESVAAGQAEALRNLVALFQQISVPLADTPVNEGFKELLKSAQVTQRKDRVVIAASVSPSLFTAADLASPNLEKKSLPGEATSPPPPASH
jgi:hypothetical protein